MYEPSIRIPLMIRYPRRIRAGTSSGRMVLNLDLAPTLLDLVELQPPAHFQGRSLMRLLARPEVAWRTDWLYEYYEYPGNEEVRPCRGVRTERYKYIHYFTEPQEFELYDLKEDPEELHNLYDDPAHVPSSSGNSPHVSRSFAGRPAMSTSTSRPCCSNRKSPPVSAKQLKNPRPTDTKGPAQTRAGPAFSRPRVGERSSAS